MADQQQAVKRQTLSQMRAKNIYKQIKKDKTDQPSVYKLYTQQLSAVLLTRALVLAPLERMKIIMQVKSLASFINPADAPKNALDLSNKISINQGFVAFFRGNNALVYKLIIQNTLKFALYESVFQNLNSKNDSQMLAVIGAGTFTALFTTIATYPLDLAHGRMAADMTKKPSVAAGAASKNAPIQHKKNRLYKSVRECLTKTQDEAGALQSRKFLNMFKGLQIALVAQIPYTVILMSSFEMFQKLGDSKNIKFNKKDDYTFLFKFITRFGASTFSLLLAQSICYPLDTVKRRMQLNGSIGHKNLYKDEWHCLRKVWNEEGYRGFYSGFSVNLVRCIPLALIQYVLFQNLRFMSKKKRQ